MLATTAFVVSEMTLTAFDPLSVTNTSPFPLSYATAVGSKPFAARKFPGTSVLLTRTSVYMTNGPVDAASTVKDRLVERAAPPPVASIDTVLVPTVAVEVAENDTVAVQMGSQGLFLKVAVTPLGSPDAEKVTGPVVPETSVALIDENGLVEPWTTVRAPGDGAARLKSKAGGATGGQERGKVRWAAGARQRRIGPSRWWRRPK